MKKGFIGPIGDDLPSILGIVLALGLFFAGISYSLNAYNQKIDNLKTMKGAIEITRVITKDGFITDVDNPAIRELAGSVAESYGLQYKAVLDPNMETVKCAGYAFTYLVASSSPEGSGLATLYVCVCRAEVAKCYEG